MAEGTKVGRYSEFDFNVYLDNISSVCNAPQQTEMGIELKLKFQDISFPTEDGKLSHHHIIGRYQLLICKSLCCEAVFEGLDFYWLAGPVRFDILNFTFHKNWIKLMWTGERFKGMVIDIDVVPAIPMDTWPENAKDPAILHPSASKVCAGLVKGWHRNEFRMTFCNPEFQIMQCLCGEIKLAYMAIKVLINGVECVQGKSSHTYHGVTSYHVKTALFYELESDATLHTGNDQSKYVRANDTQINQSEFSKTGGAENNLSQPSEFIGAEKQLSSGKAEQYIFVNDLNKYDLDIVYSWVVRILSRLAQMLRTRKQSIPTYFLPEINIHGEVHQAGVELIEFIQKLINE